MEEEKICKCCKESVHVDDYVYDEDACIHCLENDDEYRAMKKAEAAYDLHIDSLIDEARGK